jgi:hypothetical protein
LHCSGGEGYKRPIDTCMTIEVSGLAGAQEIAGLRMSATNRKPFGGQI